jgi:hypothetical protein
MIFLPKTRLGKALTRGDEVLARKIKIDEAFDMTRKGPGEIPFRNSSLTDPHIIKLIRDAAAKTGENPNDILAKIKNQIKKIEEFKKYSPILYDTIAKDAVSQAVFDLIEHAKIDKPVKFDVPTFFKLVKMIELEHQQFFPLRAPGETNYIFHIDPILVPTNKPELKKFNLVTTAAASSDGDFIFNLPFMQKLMDWAIVEGVKPTGRKYISNGGDIPDAYAFIEFLIMHELLHYSFGDFSHGRRLKQYSPQIHNWATDFRSNYMLVKNGYNQLPIGLFSDHINYDRQLRYDDMIKLVDSELKKLPKDLQDVFKDVSKMDDHPQPGQKPDQQKDKGKPQKQDGKVNVGDIVRHNDGSFGKVTQVNADGSVEIDSIPDPTKGGK